MRNRYHSPGDERRAHIRAGYLAGGPVTDPARQDAVDQLTRPAEDGPGRPRQRRGETAPRWFELITLAGVVALGFVGSIGLLLAVIGKY